MEYETRKGLMATNAQPTKRTPVLAEFLNSLAPQQPLTLEQRLAALTDSDRTFMMQLSRMVQAVMQLRIAAGDQSQGYYDLVTQMYGRVSPSKRRLVAEILNASDPLDFEPTPIRKPRGAVTSSFYDSPEMQVSPKLEPEPQQSQVAVGKEAFIAAYTPIAKEVAEDLGVSYKIVLAQAALESGWGTSVRGNGLMGIKSHGDDRSVDFTTHEVINGKKVKMTDSFRAYDTPEDSIRGYGKFLKANSRYRHFLRAGAENEDAQLSALQSSGYATDPTYSQKLKNIIQGIPDEEGQG
ncbi:glucosaminidase domain-containing protein [Planktomarina temperata]|nr:glucosaminidase domain-containing protein [Planktomarina temperata]